MLPAARIEEIVAGHKGLSLFNFQSGLRQQLAYAASGLTKALVLYLDKGEAIPDRLIEPLIKERLDEEQDLLISGFPKTIGQLELLERLTGAHNYKIAQVWHIRHRNRESFIGELLDSPEKQLWAQKFDEDHVAKSGEDFAKADDFIGQMHQAIGFGRWKTIELDYKNGSGDYLRELAEALKK